MSQFQPLRTHAINSGRSNEGCNLLCDLGAYVALTATDEGSITQSLSL
jgi:hypothetical protein